VLHVHAKSEKGDLNILLTKQSTWVSVPDPGSVLRALAKLEKGDLHTLLTEQSTLVLVPNPGLVLHALAKSEKGNSKSFLRSSRSSPSTIYAFVILGIQTWSSLYAAPLIWRAGLLSTLSAHHLINLCLFGRLSCWSSL
jgi:hypothetical protein